ALVTVGKLRGVEYDWKADGKHDIGLIAEEVGEVIPEVVAYEENGSDARSVDYARLVALLIEAVKELKAENVQLKSDLAQSETSSNDRLNTLQDQVTQLSSLIEQLVTSNENGTPSGGESVASAQQGSASRN
ncbi:MAG: tail fiber domain-containing protein, partial [candidate division Zixibacteria bacterium]|nr:tail fiber domain-containing protein [candidate division Zixibacteria bacterium]